jgi:hypothetical protein
MQKMQPYYTDLGLDSELALLFVQRKSHAQITHTNHTHKQTGDKKQSMHGRHEWDTKKTIDILPPPFPLPFAQYLLWGGGGGSLAKQRVMLDDESSVHPFFSLFF